jgi:hypothetical protein
VRLWRRRPPTPQASSLLQGLYTTKTQLGHSARHPVCCDVWHIWHTSMLIRWTCGVAFPLAFGKGLLMTRRDLILVLAAAAALAANLAMAQQATPMPRVGVLTPGRQRRYTDLRGLPQWFARPRLCRGPHKDGTHSREMIWGCERVSGRAPSPPAWPAINSAPTFRRSKQPSTRGQNRSRGHLRAYESYGRHRPGTTWRAV